MRKLSDGAVPPEPVPRRRWSAARGSGSLLTPALLLIAVCFAWPVAVLLAESFSRGGGLANYAAFFASDGLMRILWRTLWISALIVVICLLLGYPMAYLAATANPAARTILLSVVTLSLFLSLIVRCYAWLAILDRGGMANLLLREIGLPSWQFVGVHNLTGVLIGLTQFMLPYMVLSIYDVMRRVDMRLMNASNSLGANPLRAFLTVYWPLTSPGVVSGSVIVFIMTLGYYIAPSILGGPQNMMLGEVLSTTIRTTGDWGQGAAIGSVMLAVALGVFLVFQVFGIRTRAYAK